MKHFALVLTVVFVIGLGIGWLLRPDAAAYAGSAGDPSHGSRADGTGGHEMPARVRKVSAVTTSRPPAPDAVAEITSRVGLFGYSSDDGQNLVNALATWYLESPAEALEWVNGASPYDDIVGRLIWPFVSAVAREDFYKGLELTKSDMGTSGVPFAAFYSASVTHGAEAFLEVSALAVMGDYGFSDSHCKFPEGFDFHAVLSGLADQTDAMGEGEMFSHLPRNLMAEWARRDHQAAWQWLEEGREIGDHMTKQDFFAGYKDIVSEYELGKGVAEYMGYGEGGPRMLFWMLFSTLTPEADGIDVVHGYLAAADPAAREGLILEVMCEADNHLGEAGMGFRSALLSTMERNVQIRIIQQTLEGMNQIERNNFKPSLKKLGHTDQEIDELYQASPAEDPQE